MNADTPTAQAQRPLADTPWRVDPSASTAEFRVPHFWGLVTVKGHFERLDGYLELDDCGQRQMTLTIDAASPTRASTGATSTYAPPRSSTHRTTPTCASAQPA
jgi:polyisoprenoid-binding protein YceI